MINVLSLGMGVQSSCMAIMAALGELNPKPDLIVFSDPGWEQQHTYDYAQKLKKLLEFYGMNVVITNNGNIREDLLKAATDGTRVASLPFFTKSTDNGQEGMVMRQCTSEYKIVGVKKAIKKFLGVKTFRGVEPITMWMGISTDEITRVKTSTERYIINRYPLIEKGMNRLDCMNWLSRRGFEVPQKSSCIGCPFHSNETWLDMKRNDPKAWEDAVFVDNAIRHMPRMDKEVYLHRSLKPLGEVDLNENQLEFNWEGFDNECTGHCGV